MYVYYYYYYYYAIWQRSLQSRENSKLRYTNNVLLLLATNFIISKSC